MYPKKLSRKNRPSSLPLYTEHSRTKEKICQNKTIIKIYYQAYASLYYSYIHNNCYKNIRIFVPNFGKNKKLLIVKIYLYKLYMSRLIQD